MNERERRLHAAAVGYAKRGLPVMPLRHGGKRPATRHGLYDATTLWQSAEYLWRVDYCGCNVGIRTGDGLVVIDLDVDESGECIGEQTIADIEIEIGLLPETVTAETPSGGVHLYYRYEGQLKCSVGQLGERVDIRADGGYVVAPPSCDERGSWRWVRGKEIAPLPAGWAARIRERGEKGGSDERGGDSQTIRDYDRYVKAALDAEAEIVACASEGSRNHTLNRSAFKLGTLVATGRLDRSDAEVVLYGAARQCGLKPSEIERTMRSGLDAGEKARPR